LNVTASDIPMSARTASQRLVTPAAEAAARGIRPEVVKLPAAKHGFVLLPRRWVAERSFV
jgi:hypothetical protein